MGKKIFIKSIYAPSESKTGVGKFVNPDSGRALEKNKVARANTKIQPLYSKSLGGLKNYISYTPWVGEDGKAKVGTDGIPLMLQDKMEQKWAKPKGFFTNASFSHKDSHQITKGSLTYFQSMIRPLNDGSTMLDLDNMDDELFYYVALESKYIANSLQEYRAHKWPYAQFYISIESESEDLKYSAKEKKHKAIAALQSEPMTNDMLEKFAGVLDLYKTNTMITNKQSYNLLSDFLDNSSSINDNIARFTELVNLIATAPGRLELEARYVLKQALDARIVFEKGYTYTWIRQDGKLDIGSTYQEAISFILNPKKEGIVTELREAIKAKLA